MKKLKLETRKQTMEARGKLFLCNILEEFFRDRPIVSTTGQSIYVYCLHLTEYGMPRHATIEVEYDVNST